MLLRCTAATPANAVQALGTAENITEALINKITPPNKEKLDLVDAQHTQTEAVLLQKIQDLTAALNDFEVTLSDSF